MIKPDAIPLFTGDLGQLEHHTESLLTESDGIRQAGAEAHRQFQRLAAFYEAPEAEQLFASTAPARDAADAFADKVAKVADALRTYAVEVAPIAKKLEQLQGEAAAFVAGLRTEGGDFDEKWTKDEEKVQEHQALWHEVNAAQAAFAAAEIACANRITALVGGTQYVMNTGNKQFKPLGAVLYGYSAEALDQAKELPWGTAVAEKHDWWDPKDFNYYFKSLVWDGFVVDAAWGTVEGLATLAFLTGRPNESVQAWEGLVRSIVGAETYLMESGGQKPTGIFATDFAQESKAYAKEFGKGFVAWDMWEENPARAMGTVLFNAVTLGAGPLKAASAGRAGAAARAAATVAKVGEVVDPIGAAVKVTGHALPRIAQVTESLRGINTVPEARTPTSVLEFTDDTGRSVLVVENGEFVVMKDGKDVTDAPMRERSVTMQEAPLGRPPIQDGELLPVGAASRNTEATARAGDEITSRPGGEPPAVGTGSEHQGHVRATPVGEGAARAGASGAATGADAGSGQGNSGGFGRSGDFGRVGDEPAANGAAGVNGADAGVPANRQEMQRPSFMGEGTNPYGPPGTLSRQQIVEIQVYRANHEPGYRERYYYRDGRRIGTEIPDESGYPPPQLVENPRNPKLLIAKDDAPPPIPAKYVDGGDVIRGSETVSTPEVQKKLDAAAAKRYASVTSDNLWHDRVAEVKSDYEKSPTSENLAALKRVKSEHAPYHERMTSDAAAYGEAIARHHVIPEHYPGATWEELSGPKNGNDQFDQLWRRKDGGFVVIEAKSNIRTEMGKRDLPTGYSAMQGSKEYFLDIMNEMKKRGLKGDDGEAKLYRELKAALKAGKVDYILVKGMPNAGEYAGYYMRRFDLG